MTSLCGLYLFESNTIRVMVKQLQVMMHDVEIGTTMRYIGISVMLLSIIGVACVLYTKHSASVQK